MHEVAKELAGAIKERHIATEKALAWMEWGLPSKEVVERFKQDFKALQVVHKRVEKCLEELEELEKQQ